jgi:predicted transcriptional regulator
MDSRHSEARIGIASPKEMRDRLIAAARGEGPPLTKAKVWMSLETLAQLLSDDNRRMLAIIAREHPRSISALATRLDRDQGNVSRTIGRLADIGLIRLVSDGREKRPELIVDHLKIDIDLVAGHLAIA